MSDYEYQYSDDEEEFVYSDGEEGDGDDGEEGDSYAIDIENAFYEAEDVRRSDPARALELFNKVVALEKEHRPDEVAWRFKAYEHIVGLHFRLGHSEQMIEAYQSLLGCIDKVTRNECNDTINNILDTISASNNGASGSVSSPAPVSLSRMYEITLEVLRTANNERLWFNTNLKLGKMYFENGDFSALTKVVDALHNSLKTGASKDDPNKEAYLLEVYALEIAMYSATQQKAKLKEIYPKTRSLSAAIQDPRIMGGIHEAGGKMRMEEENWSDAYDEFFEGFRNYQEAGNPRAKQCLKYVVLANMIALKDINPFDSREAKVYKDDKDIMAMMRLREAFESSNVKEFEGLLHDKSLGITEDKFIMRYVNSLLGNIRAQVVMKMVEPYDRVRLEFLAQEINVPVLEVEQIIVQLILDGKVEGKLDQQRGILAMAPVSRRDAFDHVPNKHQALKEWAMRLGTVMH